MAVTLLRIEPSPIALRRHGELAHPERAVARNEAIKVFRGVYADAAEWKELAPWERYLARVHAVALLHPDAVFTHESAAALLGLPVMGDPLTVHVLDAATATARAVGGMRVHTGRGERELVELGGILLTSPVETAVDMARYRHAALGLAVADAVLRMLPDVTAEGMTARNEGRVSSRGRNLARWPLRNANSESASTLESFSRAIIEWLGFPAPLLQTTFRTGQLEDRTDFHWEGCSVVGEADGDIKYDGSLGDPIAALHDRRDRDARLRTHVRIVTHWDWAEATTFAPLRDILFGAGVPLVGPESTVPLHSLKRLYAPTLSREHTRRTRQRGAPAFSSVR